MSATDLHTVFTLTPEARSVVIDALRAEDRPGTLALVVEVLGVRAGGFAYDLYFAEPAEAGEDAWRWSDDELTVVIPAASLSRLNGARLEYSTDGGGGLVLVNPNQPSAEEANPGVPAEVLARGLDTDLAVRAIQILDESINPSIASHGGRADLVALDDERGVAYVRLSGGCQGCAMSRMTLAQGIEATLREELPELVGVVDVTDHASGTTPFYARD